jgi:hypothetical protein
MGSAVFTVRVLSNRHPPCPDRLHARLAGLIAVWTALLGLAALISARPALATEAVPAATLEQLDGFAFATRSKMGMGGAVVLDIYPVVLLKSGDLLSDVRGLRHAGGLAAHRAAHPQAWTRWRRADGKLQLLKGGQWTDLPFNKTYARLPAELRLDGRFRSSSGVGNVAIGGTQAVTRVDEYHFSSDGHVVRGGPGERAGRYRVDGLLLHIDYDDGSREQRVLITDPTRPGSTLWLDGQGYVARR